MKYRFDYISLASLFDFLTRCRFFLMRDPVKEKQAKLICF
jgi:hypothetical protein